ncbi:hypothetical protein LUZ60_017664 [Juncus effusus]|nr:hypothetical protein LUZ60_017664 [Juncus effusus]
MDNILSNTTMLSSNALGVLTSISSFMEKLNVNLNDLPLNVPHRRLMGYDMDSKNYPTWLSAGDRKLLASEDRHRLKPNAVVAKDGSGNYKTINDAIKGMPKTYKGRYVIYVKEGVYAETVTVTKEKANLYMYGDGSQKTRVTGHKSFADGLTTMDTATFSVEAPGFICKSMGFANTAGAERHQAVAFRITGDFGAFFNCRFDGYQDTLYTQARRQYFRNCVVSGTIDFIFGNSAVVFQNCLIIVRRPMDNQQNTVTAHGRKDPNMKTGIVIQNCRIQPDDRLSKDRLNIPSYLGRPWKEYSRTVVMESTIGDLIRPEGWMPWNGDFALKTLYYAEFANRGPGANTARRVKWPGFRVINKNDAAQFTVGPFINGNMWLKYTAIPHLLGFKN